MAFRYLVAVLSLAACVEPTQAQDPQRLHADACAAGELGSCTVLGLIYQTGAGGERNLERALSLYDRACLRAVAAACARFELAREGRAEVPTEDGFVRMGHVADAEDGAPVADALIELPGLDLLARADASGRVDLGRLPRGFHRIVARRVGYQDVVGELPVPWDAEFLLLMEPAREGESTTLGRVFGRVTDESTGAPLPNVEVTLSSGRRERVLSGPDGRFSFDAVPPGPVEVRLMLLNYAPRATDLLVEAGRTVEVYATLSLDPIELAPIEVTVGSAYLERSGFYLRTRFGGGTVFTRRDVARADPIAVSDLFFRAPGVRVVQTRQGAQVVSGRQGGSDRMGPCRLRPYLDGMPMIEWDVDQVRPDDVEGIEVYQGLAAPIEYRNLTDPDGSYPCGVVLIWTTRGG